MTQNYLWNRNIFILIYNKYGLYTYILLINVIDTKIFFISSIIYFLYPAKSFDATIINNNLLIGMYILRIILKS